MSGAVPFKRPKPTRCERQAQAWIRRMNDDPERHLSGLNSWIGNSRERLDAYNRLAVAMQMSTLSASLHYETRDLSARRASPRGGYAWTFATVAVGFAALGTGVAHFAGWLEPSPTRLDVSLEAYDSPNGLAREIRLADGSKIDLRPNSRIEVRLDRNVRAISLERGNAQFHVAHAASWPFVVRVGGGSVTARGTVFDVALGDTVSVKLLEGKIDVALPPGGPNRPSVVRHLAAGQSTRFDAVLATPALRLAPLPIAGSGTADVTNFDDVTVGEVVEETNRNSLTKIEVADPTIAARRVVLQLHAGDARDVAGGLAEYLDLTVDSSQPNRLLLRRKN